MARESLPDILLDRAREFLESAETDLGEERFHSAASRAYYAVFTAARALLHRRGRAAKTHGGLWSLFGRELVVPGHMEREMARIASELRSLRNISDYGQEAPVTRERAREAVEGARRFVERAEQVSRRLQE
ncbi:MAG: HEPN domain-containing protein [Halobacteria archaeon]